MLSVRLLYDVHGWAYYNNSVNLQHCAPKDILVNLGQYLYDDDLDAALGQKEPDVVVLNRFTSTMDVRRALTQRGWSSKLVVFWNNGWPHRVENLIYVLKEADLTIFTNEEMWRNVGMPNGTIFIPHGVNLDIFRSIVPIRDRPRRILWMGAELNRSIKGFDDVALPLKERLIRNGYECDFRLVDSLSGDNLTPAEMADWYNSGQVFLCTSSAEGTPNVALEAAASGNVLVSTPVGNMPELVRHQENGILVPPHHNAFYDAIAGSEECWPDLSDSMMEDIRVFDWRVLAEEYYSAFREVANPSGVTTKANGHAVSLRHVNGKHHPIAKPSHRASGKRVDLSDKVTVFVTTVGAPTYETCMRMLEQQDCDFRLRVIENFAPMSAAFQKMLVDCETEFYVQVDEDMLLYPHAVRTLFERMREQPTNVAFYAEQLFDTHVQKKVQGVKIYRHEIVKRYPFRNVEACEFDQINRFERDGFAYVANKTRIQDAPHESVLGLHGTNFTRETAYVRYLTLQRRWRSDRSLGWSNVVVELAERFRKSPTEINFFALAGAMAGRVLPLADDTTEKDFRYYSRSPGFEELAKLYETLRRNRN